MSAPRLRELARHTHDPPAPREPERDEETERCELCAAPLPAEHRHLVDVESRRLLCACRACSLLFDRRAASGLPRAQHPASPDARRPSHPAGGHFRLIPQRRLRLADFELGDDLWERLRIPVELAFFFHSTAAGRVVAFYPSPMGATESQLELSAWEEIERCNPALATLEPDVEALLVNRSGPEPRHWLVPIDDCYRLVAVIRTRWRGFTGGNEAWSEIERFFGELDRRAQPTHERSSLT